MRKTLTFVALAAASALALTGCAAAAKDGGTTGGTLAEGKTLTILIPADPGTLNPFTTSGIQPRAINRFLYGHLVELKPDGSVTTGLAEKWTADSKTATFTLRDGLTCSDGTPLTATGVAATFNHIGDAKNGSVMTGVEVQVGTTAKGDDATRTVTITSGAPDPFLLNNVGTVAIICGNAVDKPDVLAKGGGGTGAYVMEEIVPNSTYTMKRRTDFIAGPEGWDPKAKGQPAKITYSVVPSESTAVNLLLSGKANIVTVTGPDRERLTANKSLFHVEYFLPTGQFGVNQAEGRVTSDPAVRKALFQALDLAELRKVLTNGRGKPITSLVLPGMTPCSGAETVTDVLPKFDAAAAAKTLDAAGWTKGADGTRAKDGKPLTVSLPYPNTSETLAATMEIVAESWKKLGISVKLEAVSPAGQQDKVYKTRDWDVMPLSVAVLLPSTLVPFYSGPVPPGGANFGAIDNPAYDAAVAKARTKVGADGCGDWDAAERALVSDLNTVPYASADAAPFGSKVSYDYVGGIVPTSIRMYE